LRIIQKAWWVRCPVSCCWQTAVYTMKSEWRDTPQCLKTELTGVSIHSNVAKFILSTCLSISLCFLKVLKLNELKLFCSSVNTFLVLNQLLRLCQLSRHLQIKTGFVVPQHEFIIFTLVLQDVLKFPKIILSTIHLHKKSNN
jgi:hypothetical protein